LSDIHIERNHALGLARAREVARQWTDQAERDYGMACVYTAGLKSDVAKFSRAGMDGSVEVTADMFTLHMSLGFLMDTFRGAIEDKVTRNLDELLAGPGSAPA